jgi:sulfite oxidase
LNFKRVDQWKLEQGLAPVELPLLDQSIKDETKPISKTKGDNSYEKSTGIEKEAEASFAEEYPGWRGYIEWEKYPEKRAKAAAILARHKFPPPPEFQLGPIPDTNPVLEGVRWKMWHKAIGGPLRCVPEESWLRVIQEKHPDMLHLLQFPYNGEPPKVRLRT